MSTQISTVTFRSFEASDINIMLDALVVRESENQESLEQKLITLEAFKEFIIKHIKIESIPTREAKSSYIRFLSRITENIEAIELLTGRITIEQIKAAAKSFEKKWKFPIGIYDEKPL